MIDSETIDRIYDAVVIEDIINDYTPLRRRGANLIGLCPFHQEKTPSFTVSPSKRLFKCFGCGEGGNAVKFIQKIENCSYPEALKLLARRYNIEVVEKERTPEEQAREERRATMFRLNAFAMQWYEKQLWETDEGRSVALAYLHQRGIRDDIIRFFHIGYSPQRSQFVQTALKEGFPEDLLIEMCFEVKYTTDNGKEVIRDFFRDRIIFPWFAITGNVVAFNARILRDKDNTGKYINTKDIPGFYIKGNNIYNIHQAKKDIDTQKFCYIVEGQMDVISSVQAGVKNIIAGSGTAFTDRQADMLKKQTSKAVLIYDADNAGNNASLKTANKLLERGIDVRIIRLPKGEDPDSLSHSMTSDEYQQYLEQHTEDYILNLLNTNLEHAQADPINFRDLVILIASTIACISDEVTKESYIKMCSQRLDIEPKMLREYVTTKAIEQREQEQKERRVAQKWQNRLQQDSSEPSQPKTVAASQPTPQSSRRATAERELLTMLLTEGQRELYQYDDGSSCSVAQYILQDLQNDNITFENISFQRIAEIYSDHLSDPQFNPETYFSSLEDNDIVTAVSGILIDKYQLSKIYDSANNKDNISPAERQRQKENYQLKLTEKVIQLLNALKLTVIEQMIKDLQQKIEAASDDQEQAMNLLRQKFALEQLRRQRTQQ